MIMGTITNDLKRAIKSAEEKGEEVMCLFLTVSSAREILQALHTAQMWEDQRKARWRDE